MLHCVCLCLKHPANAIEIEDALCILAARGLRRVVRLNAVSPEVASATRFEYTSGIMRAIVQRVAKASVTGKRLFETEKPVVF